MDLLKFIDARLGESSTYASLAVLLALVHVNVDPGTMHVAALWGAVAASVLGVVLAEVGSGKTVPQIASDALGAFLAALKVMPAPAPTTASTTVTATTTAPVGPAPTV